MALITFGSGLADARGSLGGQVFSRNKGGAYLRARVAPINVKSPAQTAVRAAFAANAKAWGSLLTAAQRQAWTTFAQDNPMTNILGASIIVSGIAMFQKLNQVLVQSGGTLETDPPADLTVPALAAGLSVSADVGSQVVEVNTDAQAVVAGASYYVFATRPLSPGKNPATSDFRFVATVAPIAAATTIQLNPNYITLFGPFISGQVIGVLIATVNTSTGALTPGIRFQTVAA